MEYTVRGANKLLLRLVAMPQMKFRRCLSVKSVKRVKYDTLGSERAFMSGVLVLTVSTVIVKIIGLAYKIPLLSVLGTEGMGYFNTAYEIFALLCGVSTSGMPIAVSMLVSSARETGNGARARGIYKTSAALLLTKGVLFSGGLALLAEPVARAVGNPQSYLAILAISPALLFSCIAGAIRGYFQGCRVMLPTAISQLTEALGKLIIGVLFAAFAVKAGMGVAVAAAFAVLGVSLGSLFSAMYLLIRKRAEARDTLVGGTKDKPTKYFFELFRISLPITVCSALTGCTRIIDMTLIMRRLGDIGVSSAEANKIYGAYTTLALPIFGLVPAFVPPITESLIPRLSAAIESKHRSEEARAVSGAARLTVFIAMPSAMGIALYSKQIISLLFGGETQAISVAAPLLSALGASVLFSCLITATNAILQSYRRVLLPIISLGVGAIVKALSAYLLIGDPDIGVMGAPISTFLSNAAVLALNLCFVSKSLEGRSGILSQLPKPFFASVVAMLASYAAYLPLSTLIDSDTLAFLGALAVAVIMYFALCVMLKVVSKDDIKVIKRKK